MQPPTELTTLSEYKLYLKKEVGPIFRERNLDPKKMIELLFEVFLDGVRFRDGKLKVEVSR